MLTFSGSKVSFSLAKQSAKSANFSSARFLAEEAEKLKFCMRLSFFVAVTVTKDEIFVSVVRLLRDSLIYCRYALKGICRTTVLPP